MKNDLEFPSYLKLWNEVEQGTSEIPLRYDP